MNNGNKDPHRRTNSSNPRPGQSPFPQLSIGVTPSWQKSDQYSSQYRNNFNQSNSRYSSARKQSGDNYSPPPRSYTSPPRQDDYQEYPRRGQADSRDQPNPQQQANNGNYYHASININAGGPTTWTWSIPMSGGDRQTGQGVDFSAGPFNVNTGPFNVNAGPFGTSGPFNNSGTFNSMRFPVNLPFGL
jgi:hypothetical protein